MKKVTFIVALILFFAVAFSLNVSAEEISYVADNGETLVFEAITEDLFEGWGSFDTEESLSHFTTGGYLVEGDTKTPLSDAPSYWRYNEDGYLEALGNAGSTTKSSLLTFVPLNGGEEIGEEKMYYFSMKVYTATEKELKIAWNATKSEQFWSIYSGTEYGGRYPDYGSAADTLDNENAIDNNASIYSKGGWQTVDGYMIAKSDARYFMLNCRYMKGSSSDPTCIDDVVLYEVKTHGAGAQIFTTDYVIYDTLPVINGTWSDTNGLIVNGVYTQPEKGCIDTITAKYDDETEESFVVEIVGKNAVDSEGGNYLVKGKNLLKNASFEYYEGDNRANSEGATYPFIYSWESTISAANSAGINNATNGCFEISRDRFVTGKSSMRVRYSDSYNNHSSFNQFVTLDEGLYYLSYYARRTTSDKRDLEIRLNGECVHSFNAEIILPEWSKYSAVFEANEGDVFEFTGYNASSVYVDSFLLVPVQKLDAECSIVIKDVDGNMLSEKAITNLAEGARYTYQYNPVEEISDTLYVYKEGNYVINSLGENNVITLVYEEIETVENTYIEAETPHHKYPSLPKNVVVIINEREVKLEAEWDEAKEKDYEKEGNVFLLTGTAGGYIDINAQVEVIRNHNYLENTYSSTDDFTTLKKKATTGEDVEISFDILPLYANIDGSIGFTGDDVTVDAWNSCGITMRIYTDGRFQYYDGDLGFVKSNVFYRSNTAYTVRIFANLADEKYSIYVSQKGSEYALEVCEDASFRVSAPDVTNIGQMMARGGNGAPSGQFEIANVQWGNVLPVSFLRCFKGDDGLRHIQLKANETGTSKLYYTNYTDGYLGDMYTEEVTYTKGDKFTLVLENADRKLMMIDNRLMPEMKSVELFENGDKSFVSSFMGSFAYYSNQYNSGIVDEDPGIVQVNIMEIFSDRITITTKNYGEYTGDEAEPEPSVFERYNGDDSQTDTPIMRFLLFGDYQIGYDLLANENVEPLRPVFVRVCNDLENEDFDGVLIGGDLTHASSVTKERWQYVVDCVLGMLKEKISPNIYIIAGNHDYNTGERDNYNSADYYNAYMKENLGELMGTDGYFEQSEYYEGDVLVGFVYEQNGIYFMGLSTSPDMMRGGLQNTNYNYTEGAMDWVAEKLNEIGEDETVIFMAHFPLGDSNNIIKSSKGAAEGSTVRLLEILRDYPNLVYLYGHDHGSSFAFINEKTEERVTRYDTNGYKID